MTNKSGIGARLKEEREALGLRQEELAQQIGRSRNTISAWERGEQYPSGEFISIAQGLGLDLLYILTGERAAPSTLSPEEQALLDNYRAAKPEGQAAARAVLASVEKQGGAQAPGARAASG